METPAPFLRRRGAAKYLKDRYCIGSERTLAKLACVGGGPNYRKLGSHIVVYEPQALDAWARARLSEPRNNTSEIA